MRYTDELAAYCAAQWGSGISQQEIAAVVLQQTYPTSVCVLIRTFLKRWSVNLAIRDGYVEAFGPARRALVKNALANYVASRG